MPKLEHAKLMFRAHKRECLNGASDLGIQHLSALSKVEVEIWGDCVADSNYDPTEDENDGAVRWVASAINDASMIHPNRPTIRFRTKRDECEQFECVSSLLLTAGIDTSANLLVAATVTYFFVLFISKCLVVQLRNPLLLTPSWLHFVLTCLLDFEEIQSTDWGSID